MKKYIGLFILLFICYGRAGAQTGWTYFKADDKLGIKMPVEPKQIGPDAYAAMDSDSISYSVSIVDLYKAAKMDSVTVAAAKTSKDFTDEIKNGLQQSMPGATLEDLKVGNWNGYTSYTTTGKLGTRNATLYMFMIVRSTKVYILATIVPHGKSVESSNYYFRSARITT